MTKIIQVHFLPLFRYSYIKMIRLIYVSPYGKLPCPKSIAGNRLGPLLKILPRALAKVPDSHNGKQSPTD